MDLIDEADKLIEELTALAVSKAKKALSSSGTVRCEDCGCTIPIKRRKAIPSCTRCIDCQIDYDEVNHG